ncbi:MAG: hypothetical protein UY72_C0004G0015, partial [Candidatus Uhrbacteria bacterium GW2011_GWD2_52_7]
MTKTSQSIIGFVGLVLLGISGAAILASLKSTTELIRPVHLFVTLTDTRPQNQGNVEQGQLPSNTLRSAWSRDGYTFTLDEQHWLTSDDMADPSISVNDEGIWVVASGTGHDALRGTASSLCPSFDAFPEVIQGGGIPDVMTTDNGFRIYYSGDGGILSAFSADGTSFAKEQGVRLPTPDWLNLIADPTVTQRTDGTYVMYFKGTTTITTTPYEHSMYRATSSDGLVWSAENDVLIEHASVPGAYTDASGRVWIYYLNFGAGWPNERESVWATYETADGDLVTPKAVTFTTELPDYLWVNDPDPVMIPTSLDLNT